MKKIFILIVFITLANCSNNKSVYWCGDHQCINKNEQAEYFKKTMIVEIKEIKKKTKNSNSKKDNKLKQNKLDEKRRIQDEKALEKKIKKDQKSTNKVEKKNINSTFDDTNSSHDMLSSTIKFNDLVNKIIEKNSLRPYPDINDIPN
tara:strand:+ start:53 stop:493 length:441 start_codon:yes stop_codon:yes gene_type:complete